VHRNQAVPERVEPVSARTRNDRITATWTSSDAAVAKPVRRREDDVLQ